VLQRHWRILALSVVTFTAAVAIATFLMKPTYEPEARIEVDPPGNELFSLQSSGPVSSDTEYLQTQVQALQSDALALEVIRKLQLAPDSPPQASAADLSSSTPDAPRLTPGESTAVRDFQKRLSIQHDPGSRLIGLKCASHDPVEAAKITNTLASLFVERSYKARHNAIVQSTEWLSGQLEDIHKRMLDSVRALTDFQRATGVAEVDEGKSTFGEMLAEENRQFTQSAVDRIQQEALLNKVRKNRPDALPQVRGSALVQQLTQKAAEIRAQLADARVIYGENHPKVKQLKNQAEELERQLNIEKQTILEELKTTYAAAQAREHLMSGQVKNTTRQLTLIGQYNALKREALANTELYNNLYSKVKEAGIAAASKSSNVRVVDTARVLDRPTRPRRLLNIVLGFIAGLVFGVVGVFVAEGLDNTIRTPEDIHNWNAELPVAIVPVIEGHGKSAVSVLRLLDGVVKPDRDRPLLVSHPRSPAAEALRGLRTSIMLSAATRPQALLVASSFPGEGKTTLAINLGVSLARQASTCLVDCDLRKPSLGPAFGLSARDGVSNVLAGVTPLSRAVADTRIPRLAVLPAGNLPESEHLISSEMMGEVIRELRKQFTFVVVDSPPILPYVDGRILSTMVDGILLVGRPHVTTRAAMARALELFSEVNSAPILEVVLNAAEGDSPDYRYYQYG
jgi:capsular exopolysaccharide synthesis family protein